MCLQLLLVVAVVALSFVVVPLEGASIALVQSTDVSTNTPSTVEDNDASSVT